MEGVHFALYGGCSFCTVWRVLILHCVEVLILHCLQVLIVHCLEGAAHLHYVKGANFVHAERLLIFHCLKGAPFAQSGGCSVCTVWMVLIFHFVKGAYFAHCLHGDAHFSLYGGCSVSCLEMIILHYVESAHFALCAGCSFCTVWRCSFAHGEGYSVCKVCTVCTSEYRGQRVLI